MVDFSKLNPEFVDKINTLISNMESKGYTIQPQSGLRTLEQQGKIWRQGRSTSEINTKIQMLRSLKCDVLADAIESVGPQSGNIIRTKVIPGYSWHNWGEALDVFVNEDPSGCDSLYGVLAREAVSLGLTSGFNFISFKDPGHIQYRQVEIPRLYTMKEVNDHFAS